MKRAGISETKNNLSRFLDEVKRGESILILDRNKPVATIEPYREAGLHDLVRDGILSPPRPLSPTGKRAREVLGLLFARPIDRE